MSLLLPLGLLGLTAIAVLVLIYIIRPHYQQKFVSSTYVWKLSLKYKKKTVPVNKLKNIIIFICQVLILVSCAFLLARPVIPTEKVSFAKERVAIIDASASMLADNGDTTRFERAVDEAKKLAGRTAGEDGVFSVIVAGEQAYFSVQRLLSDKLEEINDALDELAKCDERLVPIHCTYARADIEGAALLAEQVLLENPEAEVVLYTATTYLEKGKFQVVDVSSSEDWNAAILGCDAVLEENYYAFSVDVGCYGSQEEITVSCSVQNYNGTGREVKLNPQTEYFDFESNRKTITFSVEDQREQLNEPVYSFDYIFVSIDENDSISVDNYFYLYGGTQTKIKVQYASSEPNRFVRGALQSMRETMKGHWNVEITEVRKGGSYATKGFDYYIFEHTAMPETLPTDGVVLLIDPSPYFAVEGVFRMGERAVPYGTNTLLPGTPHDITKNIAIDKITISQYVKIASHDNFEELMYYGGDPMLLAKNTPEEKIAILSLNVHYSNIAIRMDFPQLLGNIFNYYIPSTVAKHSYEVGEEIGLNARGSKLDLMRPGAEEREEFTELPAKITAATPGSYTVTQYSLREELIEDRFYVSIANSESDITKEVDALPVLNVVEKTETMDKDLLIYIAAALVALLFVEWWLQARENY